ncbi:MAG: hypothetical protein DMF60_20960 [Acidobacteria bacterium]|nr:MAG: hypothetical protein DMF60_20960 [Acidobacteriota bacterium]
MPLCQLSVSKTALLFGCQKTKGASPSAHKAQKRPAPFVSFIELDLEILGAGIRSRWINAAVVNNRRTGVRPISWRL